MDEEEKIHNMKYRCLELASKAAAGPKVVELAREMYDWILEKKDENNRV